MPVWGNGDGSSSLASAATAASITLMLRNRRVKSCTPHILLILEVPARTLLHWCCKQLSHMVFQGLRKLQQLA